MNEYGLAIRLLIVYESKLPVDGKATLNERVEAMEHAVKALKLQPGEVDWESLGLLGD